MEKYRIFFQEGEEEDVLRILGSSRDVHIDQVNTNQVVFSITGDHPHEVFEHLLDRVDQLVYAFRPHYGYY